MHYGEPNALSLLRELVRARSKTKRSLAIRDVSRSCDLSRYQKFCDAFCEDHASNPRISVCARCPLMNSPDPATQMRQYFSRDSYLASASFCGYRHLLLDLTDPDAAIISRPILEQFTQEFGESAVQAALSRHVQEKEPNPL